MLEDLSYEAQVANAKAVRDRLRYGPTLEERGLISAPKPKPKPISERERCPCCNQPLNASSLRKDSGTRYGPSVALIIKTVAEYYRCDIRDIKSLRRTQGIVRPRQIIMYLARMMTPRSYQDIGRCIGGFDHSTVISGIARIEGQMEVNIKLVADIAALRAQLESSGPV